MKKVFQIGIFLLFFVVAAAFLFNYSNANEGIEEEHIDRHFEYAIDTSEGFIKSLFSANEEVLNYVTGDVKNNLSNNLSDMKKFKINDVICSVEYASDNFATVNTVVEYEKNSNEVDVDFYRFYLINNNDDGFLIYKLENNMVFDNASTVNDDIEISTTGATKALDSYFEQIQNGKLSESSNYLVGKAKADHINSYSFVAKVKDTLNYNFSELSHSLLSSDMGRLLVVKSQYKNNDNDVSIISTLFKTSKGWKIYDITQI